MAREVVWTEPAWEDLEAASEYIARDSEYYAAAFVREVKEAAESLSEFAERGQIVPELRDPTTRELLIRPYRLVYRLSSSQVTIIAVIQVRAGWGGDEPSVPDNTRLETDEALCASLVSPKPLGGPSVSDTLVSCHRLRGALGQVGRE